MNLTQILEATVSPDQNELQQAETYLEQAAQENLPQFIVALVNELADGGKSQVARMAAGLQLKNGLTSKDPNIRKQHQQRWLSLDEQVKLHVKQMVIQTLGTEAARPAIAPQCIAAIACAEFPIGQWLEVIDDLYNMVIVLESTDALKEQALQSIGYICEDVDPKCSISWQSHKILTAIVRGMGKDQPNFQIRLAASNALSNSLEFLEQCSGSKEDFLHAIMRVVCEGMHSDENQLKVAALQIVVKIVSLSYHHLLNYMEFFLFPVSISAIISDCDELSLQGIEFWSSVCDEEMDLAIEAAEAAESNLQPARTRWFCGTGALQELIPVLINSLMRQGEFDDKDGWSLRKAAGTCLMLLAECCQDDVLPHLLAILMTNREREDWESRDAAVTAFGSILEGLHLSTLEILASSAMSLLIQLMIMNDESVIVTESMARTLCRICELLPLVALANLNPLIGTLLKGLDAEPCVAINACRVLQSVMVAALEEETPLIDRGAMWFSVSERLYVLNSRLDANQEELKSAVEEASRICRRVLEMYIPAAEL
ncbi:importin subunit beta-1-like [Acropora muricata]|uniref:importin subunit beta-1-like n=1 Tax=Acropora muricata TaxID=159855 RepID=UPI0034E422BE